MLQPHPVATLMAITTQHANRLDELCKHCNIGMVELVARYEADMAEAIEQLLNREPAAAEEITNEANALLEKAKAANLIIDRRVIKIMLSPAEAAPATELPFPDRRSDRRRRA